MHGEALASVRACRARAPAAACKQVIQCRNGDLVRLVAGNAGVIDEVPAGRLYKDGSLLVEADARTVADRRRLSFAGAVSVALALTDKGELAADPELDLIGIPERDRDGGSMHEAVYDAVLETFESLPRGAPARSRRGGRGGAPRRARRRSPSAGARSRCATCTS